METFHIPPFTITHKFRQDRHYRPFIVLPEAYHLPYSPMAMTMICLGTRKSGSPCCCEKFIPKRKDFYRTNLLEAKCAFCMHRQKYHTPEDSNESSSDSSDEPSSPSPTHQKVETKLSTAVFQPTAAIPPSSPGLPGTGVASQVQQILNKRQTSLARPKATESVARAEVNQGLRGNRTGIANPIVTGSPSKSTTTGRFAQVKSKATLRGASKILEQPRKVSDVSHIVSSVVFYPTGVSYAAGDKRMGVLNNPQWCPDMTPTVEDQMRLNGFIAINQADRRAGISFSKDATMFDLDTQFRGLFPKPFEYLDARYGVPSDGEVHWVLVEKKSKTSYARFFEFNPSGYDLAKASQGCGGRKQELLTVRIASSKPFPPSLYLQPSINWYDAINQASTDRFELSDAETLPDVSVAFSADSLRPKKKPRKASSALAKSKGKAAIINVDSDSEHGFTTQSLSSADDNVFKGKRKKVLSKSINKSTSRTRRRTYHRRDDSDLMVDDVSFASLLTIDEKLDKGSNSKVSLPVAPALAHFQAAGPSTLGQQPESEVPGPSCYDVTPPTSGPTSAALLSSPPNNFAALTSNVITFKSIFEKEGSF